MKIPLKFRALRQLEHSEGLEFHSKPGLFLQLALLFFVAMNWLVAFRIRRTGEFGEVPISREGGFWLFFLFGCGILTAGILVRKNRYSVIFDHSLRQVRLRAISRFSSNEISHPYESATLQIYDNRLIDRRGRPAWLADIDEVLILEVGRHEVILAAAARDQVRRTADRLAELTGVGFSIAPDYLHLTLNDFSS